MAEPENWGYLVDDLRVRAERAEARWAYYKAEVERLREAMREAMDATGTSTLTYHLLHDALAAVTRTEGAS